MTEAFVCASLVTGTVSFLSRGLVPDRYVAALVGFVFLAAVWLLVWRRDDAHVVRFGLSLGGLVLPGPISPRRLGADLARAFAWAAGLGLVAFVPFYFGWRAFWHPRGPFVWHGDLATLANDAFGQLVIIALPEEAFYRGYLQSRLDDGLPSRITILGAKVGPGLLLTSVIFALGHFATIPSPLRLAVFFPSLLFGWLRARTGGIGAGVLFHAACNVFQEILTHGYRL